MKVRIGGTHLCLTKASATHQCLINETRKSLETTKNKSNKSKTLLPVLYPTTYWDKKREKKKKSTKKKGVVWEREELCPYYTVTIIIGYQCTMIYIPIMSWEWQFTNLSWPFVLIPRHTIYVSMRHQKLHCFQPLAC